MAEDYTKEENLNICNMTSQGKSLPLAKALVNLSRVKSWPAGDAKRKALTKAQKEVKAAQEHSDQREAAGKAVADGEKRKKLEKEIKKLAPKNAKKEAPKAPAVAAPRATPAPKVEKPPVASPDDAKKDETPKDDTGK